MQDPAVEETRAAAPPASPKADPRAGAVPSRRVVGLRVDATDYLHAAETILAQSGSGGGMTCVATVHMVMEAQDDPAYRRQVNAADLVTPDGMPLVWMLRRLGVPDAQRVYGPDLVPVVCRLAAERGVPVGFFGGDEQTLETLVARLRAQHPTLRVDFAHSPPFRPLHPEEDAALVEAILDSGVRILFVGLGCPKQERWMAAHRARLDCALVGVGAAFDFLAGRKARAPHWMQRAGLEWLFRLAHEPRRLWRRYAVHNPRFVWRALRQLARGKAA